MHRIGVLALQGAFLEHVRVLESLGVQGIEVRMPTDLDQLDGLILPGGETTSQRKLAKEYGLWEPLRRLAGPMGLPVMATCAGLILLSHRVSTVGQPLPEGDPVEELSLDLLDVDVSRNAYGRQVHSFESLLDAPCLETVSVERVPFRAIFIRAPVITRVGTGVSVLCYRGREAVAVEQENILALTFHPEICGDRRFHLFFMDKVHRRGSLARERRSA